MQCTLNYNHYRPEIQSVSMTSILPKALADHVSLYEIQLLILHIVASTSLLILLCSNISKHNILIWHRVFLILCLCFVDSHLYKGCGESGQALTPVSQMLCIEVVLLQGHCILIRCTNREGHTSLLGRCRIRLYFHTHTHTTALSSSEKTMYTSP